MNVSQAGQILLFDLAKHFDVLSSQIDPFIKDGQPVVLTVEDVVICFAYSPMRDCFFLVTEISDALVTRENLLEAFILSRELACRRTRVAMEPSTKSFVLVRDFFVSNTRDVEALRIVEEFVKDALTLKPLFEEVPSIPLSATVERDDSWIKV
jgi:hypothetical protein